MIARRNPSVTKVQYLLHLQECHVFASQACRANTQVILRLFQPLPIPFALHSKSELLWKYADDFTYLAAEIDKHAGQLTELRQVIVEQVDLFDKRRNKIIGFFIAIYVPLAFTTVRDHSQSSFVALLTETVLIWDEHTGCLKFRVLVQQHNLWRNEHIQLGRVCRNRSSR